MEAISNGENRYFFFDHNRPSLLNPPGRGYSRRQSQTNLAVPANDPRTLLRQMLWNANSQNPVSLL
jgi:hypothetical protein